MTTKIIFLSSKHEINYASQNTKEITLSLIFYKTHIYKHS